MSLNNSEEKIIENSVKGAVKGLLEFSKDQIDSIIKRIRDKKFAFIGDEKTIETAREQYQSGESKFYHTYIHNKEFLFLIGMGLTLRKVESNDEKRQNLRAKILYKHKVRGLHIAEFVQNGILNRYIGILLEIVNSIVELEKQIEEVLRNIEKHSLFIQHDDTLGTVIRKALTITDAHNPNIFVISGEGVCVLLIKENVLKISDSLKDYSLKRISTAKRECLFFRKK
ncbi:MAG: hypothetical protein AABW47_03690 [Nanoarchaeota archaeon]